jgi:ferric-dicitrate binding protein FerR (iron transport regulator)
MDEAAADREPLLALVEDYLTGRIDEARLQELEARLRDDPEARREFVRYARLHTDLHFELRAREASERVLDAIGREPESQSAMASPASQSCHPTQPAPAPRPSFARRRAFVLTAVAAGLLVAVGLGWWALRPSEAQSEVAWLVNAQNCTWTGGEPPRDLRPGKLLSVERGLAEFQFQCGARVILEGPAQLELLSATSARLHRGKLTARMPPGASGFEVLSPQGKVVDLGTEFGIAVSEEGATSVRVFEGRVEVQVVGAAAPSAVSLTQNQVARIADGKVTIDPPEPPGHFVRSLAPPPLVTRRELTLTFDRPAAVDGGIRDDAGLPTGFTHRLPGTGTALPNDDPNLRLIPEKGQLELTTTKSDLNTQSDLPQGEYFGIRLADLGFTGPEDFEVSVTILDIPALEFIGQFGVYAGPASHQNIRGGLISARRKEPGQYTQFLVINRNGDDSRPYKVGLFETGTDLRITLRREAGTYTLRIENLTTAEASTLTARHPPFPDAERDVHVGVFGANTQSEVRRTLVIKEFRATVWTVAPIP